MHHASVEHIGFFQGRASARAEAALTAHFVSTLVSYYYYSYRYL